MIVIVALGVALGEPAAGNAQEGEEDDALQRHIRQAVSAVKAQDFDSAADHYLAAHAISPRPLLLYNAAYALGRAGRLKRALDVSGRAREEGLSEEKATTRNLARRRGWSTALMARETAESRERPPTSPPQAARSTSPPTLEWLGAGTMVAAGGLFGGAALLDAQIGREAETLADARADGDRQAYDQSLKNIDNLQRGGRILIVGGSLLLAGGATMTLWGLLDDPDESATAVVPTLGPDGSFVLQFRGPL